MPFNHNAVDSVRRAAVALTGASNDYDQLLDLISDARFVLLGEASHGTHEFYRERARITRLLIEHKGFNAVAAEADWPDAYRANLYVRGRSADQNADQALAGFRRFPAWMWRNTIMTDFVDWLRQHNDALPRAGAKVGFYGLDLYSLHGSIESVLTYLDKVDPEAARRARHRYACFEHFGEDPQTYGYQTEFGLSENCEREVVEQLVELRRRAAEYARRDGYIAEDEFFAAEQNARVVRNAEQYYRSMFGSRVSSWNLRDQHMAETLDALADHIQRQRGTSRIVVWAHNSHLGDARATEMGEEGEWNVGQLTRERHPGETVNVGFSTYAGAVTAASDWGGDAERKRVRPALAGSYEALFHDIEAGNFLPILRGNDALSRALAGPKLERAIGVVYLPQSERRSHYFQARLPKQFDAVLHFDETTALEPLERSSVWDEGELPETYPYAV
jgi:erythromycin esterase-like protein